jgi:tRNA (guanine-N7-)-methyltransferase
MTQDPSIRFFPANWIEPFSAEDLFSQSKPLEVDVGCGKGRFLLEHAARHPEHHFLGIDRMLRRIRKIMRAATRRDLHNIRLMRIDAYYAVAYLLPPASVSTYYVFFPDPWPKKKHHDNRLFNAVFLDAICRTLLPGGTLHFASDHLPYHEEVRKLLLADNRFIETDPYVPTDEEKSDFELKFIELPIGRCSVRMKQ